jgi:hypothetical protein
VENPTDRLASTDLHARCRGAIRGRSVVSATETIVGFAAKQVVDKVFGGPTKIVTAYHKTHFVVLSRALAEANRDARIQDSLAKVRESIKALTTAGVQILRAIPDPPVPPSSDLSFLADREKAAAFQKRCEDYLKGVQAVIGLLEEYIAKAKACMEATTLQLKTVEGKLNMQGAKWGAFRQISNSARQTDIQFLQLDDIPDLQRQISRAETLLRKYRNH